MYMYIYRILAEKFGIFYMLNEWTEFAFFVTEIFHVSKYAKFALIYMLFSVAVNCSCLTLYMNENLVNFNV